jgi:hypothetical protein
MSKKKIQNKVSSKWILWLLLVILWNYGFPDATPFQDVIVAIFLSLFLTFFKKLN